ncbi:MAG: hypothetical protein RLZZ61_765 [Pseudomonadota bacterium]|jgi:hypothetical protein
MTDRKSDGDDKWSTTAKVGAAVGSAALVAALLYAGRRSLTQKKGKLEPMSPEPEAEPISPNHSKTETD